MKVSVEKIDYTQIGGSQEYRLMVTNYGRTSIAGPRVLRGGIHPDIQWTYGAEEAAQAAAKKLQQYFDDLARSGKISKRALRAFGS